MQLWTWRGEMQTWSTGFHGLRMVFSLFIHLFDMTANSSTHPLCNDTAYLYPGTVARQKSPPFTGRHAQYIISGWSPETYGQGGWVSEPGPPHTGLLLPAALPCSGEFIYICIYHPIKALSLSRWQYPPTGTDLQERRVWWKYWEKKHHGSPLFNETIFWEQSIKRARHLSDRWVSKNFSVSTRKAKSTLILNRNCDSHVEINLWQSAEEAVEGMKSLMRL